VLGITSGSREIAIFYAAMTIAGYVWTFATVFGGMFLPKVSKLIYGEKSDPKAIQTLMIKVGRIEFVMLGAIISIFIVVGKDFFLNWLGTDFKNSYLITVLLVIPGLITIPQQIASTTLIASNQVRYNAFSKIIVAVLSISLSYILSLRYGSTGAGIAILIGNLIGGVLVMNIIYARVLKINIWEFFRKCHVSLALPFILVIIAGIVLNYLIEDISWVNTISKTMILLIVYAFSAYLLAINSYEKDLILGVVRKVIR
jgi:O-antigen/teichoic acid export membrane protein